MPALPLFAADRLEQTKQEIRASKLQIACVSSSAQMYVEDPAKRAKELADARRFIDLAAALGAPYVRVFGGKAESDKSPMPSDDTKARVAAGLRELGKYAGPLKVTVIIESHDHFTSSATLKDVLHSADSEHVGLALGRSPHLRNLERGSGIYGPPTRLMDPSYSPEGFDRQR